MARAKNDQIHRFAISLGVDEESLRTFMQQHVTAANINDFGRFDELVKTVDVDKAKAYLEEKEGAPIKRFRLPMKIHQILMSFILEDGFDEV